MCRPLDADSSFSDYYYYLSIFNFSYLFLPEPLDTMGLKGAGFWGREGTQVGGSRGADWTGYGWLAEEERNRRKRKKKKEKRKKRKKKKDSSGGRGAGSTREV